VVAAFGHQRCSAGKSLRVHGKDVEVRLLNGVGTAGTRVNAPLVEEDGKIPVRSTRRIAGVNDEQPLQAQRHLDHLVEVRVVHMGAMLSQRELIRERLPRLDRLLRL
jgi:hypothetical protein